MNNFLKNKKYIIFDNIISTKKSNAIEEHLLSNNFPWYITMSRDKKGNFLTSELDNTTKKWLKNKNVVDKGQLVHTFFYRENFSIKNELIKNSSFSLIVEDLLKDFQIKIKNKIDIIRIKSNLIFESKQYTKKTYGIPHLDSNESHYVLIYYVNDCDGDTLLFDDKEKIVAKISPKKGRILFFKGNILHANGHPTKSNYRCVINFNININNE
jgi:hypothetical protein